MNAMVIHEKLINSLYREYEERGFVDEDSVLQAVIDAKLPLDEIDNVCTHLLSMGTIIRNTELYSNGDDEEYDRSKIDYEQIFKEVLEIDNSLLPLIEYVRSIQAPQHREWQNLLPQVKSGNEYAKTRMVEMYMRTVIRIALWHQKKYNTPLAESIQDACRGFLISLYKYEMDRADVFPTYFPWWVRQYIVRETAFPINPIVYFPVHIKEKLFTLWDLIDEHVCEKCYSNTICPGLVDEIVQKFGYQETIANKFISYFIPFESIEEIYNNNEISLSDSGDFEEKMLDEISCSMKISLLNEALDSLKPRESEILKLRYGLIDGKERTLEQVGALFNLTRERIRQIESKALRKLRHPTRIRKLKD